MKNFFFPSKHEYNYCHLLTIDFLVGSCTGMRAIVVSCTYLRMIGLSSVAPQPNKYNKDDRNHSNPYNFIRQLVSDGTAAFFRWSSSFDIFS